MDIVGIFIGRPVVEVSLLILTEAGNEFYTHKGVAILINGPIFHEACFKGQKEKQPHSWKLHE